MPDERPMIAIPSLSGLEDNITAVAPEDLVMESERAEPSGPVVNLVDVLTEMGDIYRKDHVAAVRGQIFIKCLHKYIGSQLDARLTKLAKRRGIRVAYEATILGTSKLKDVDVCVLDPNNGPLLTVGVRSQMSSVGKNVLTYYEGIVGECISLEDRFPMSTHGYVYLHPLAPIKAGLEDEVIDHTRYARMFKAITGRDGLSYKTLRGIYDQFAYLIVDFTTSPPQLRDDILQAAVPNMDLRISNFVERMVTTFNERHLFWEVFE